MPGCFRFYRKGDTSQSSVTFSVMDDELRAHLGVAPHPTSYYRGWYDAIGLAVAMGVSLEKQLETAKANPQIDAEELKIYEFLNDNFTSDAWYAPRSVTG